MSSGLTTLSKTRLTNLFLACACVSLECASWAPGADVTLGVRSALVLKTNFEPVSGGPHCYCTACAQWYRWQAPTTTRELIFGGRGGTSSRFFARTDLFFARAGRFSLELDAFSLEVIAWKVPDAYPQAHLVFKIKKK